MKEAVVKVAAEYRADWMLQPNEGSDHLLGELESIYAQGKPNLTFYELVKQGFQNTREDFLNRAEVAKTSAEILYRAQVQSDRQRAINRLVQEHELVAERRAAAEQAAFDAQLEARARPRAAYASTANEQQYAQQQNSEPVQRRASANPSRYDPENVGWDSKRGYTTPRYRSDEDASNNQAQTGPKRFQDQNGRWYEQPPGSTFARDERTGKQCFVNGAFVYCK